MVEPSHCPPQAAEYFKKFTDGRYDDFAHLGYIYPVDKTRLSQDRAVFVIGTAGVDGLEFAYRAEMPGIWIWYPIGREWRRVADNLDTLDSNWRSRTLQV